MKFATLLAFSASVYGIAFDGPLPTPVTDLVYAALNGFTPKPTPALPELFRRQKPSSNPAVCGFLNGDGGMYVRPSCVKLRRTHPSQHSPLQRDSLRSAHAYACPLIPTVQQDRG
jgi:hypothetical protein